MTQKNLVLMLEELERRKRRLRDARRHMQAQFRLYAAEQELMVALEKEIAEALATRH